MMGWQTAAVTALCVVTGTVYDAQHHPLGAVKVYLQSEDKKTIAALTNAQGIYRVSVPSGKYVLRTDGDTATITAEPNKTTTANLTQQPAFFDEPLYKSAGVTDYSYRGGHGSDAVFRSAEDLAKALKNEKAGGAPKEESLYEQGTDLLNHHKAREAAEVFRKGAIQFPQSVRMLLGMAAALYSAGSYDESAQWFFKATDVIPGNPEPYLYLGKARAHQITDSSGYKERMARFVKLRPQNALANYYYANTLPDSRAREALQKAVALDPQLAPAHVKLGIIAAREGDYPAAIRSYLAAIAADSQLEEAHYRISEAYRITGESAKAREELSIFERLSKASAERQ
jgi:tetratricopeptide (TPR) repeat protein